MFSDEIGDNLVTSVFNYDEAEPAVINIDDIDAIDDQDFPDDIELPDPFDDWEPPIADEPKVESKPPEYHEDYNKNKFERVAEFEELEVECGEDEFVIPLIDNTPRNQRLQIVFVKHESDDDLSIDMKMANSPILGQVNGSGEGTRSPETSHHVHHRNPIKSLAGPRTADSGNFKQTDRFADRFCRNDANGNQIYPAESQTKHTSGLILEKADADCNSCVRPSSVTSSNKHDTYEADIVSAQESPDENLSNQKSPVTDQKPISSAQDKACPVQESPPDKSLSSHSHPSSYSSGFTDSGYKITDTQNIAITNQVNKVVELADDTKEQDCKESVRIEGSSRVNDAREKAVNDSREKVVSARRVLVPARRRSAPNFQPPPPPSFAPPPLPGGVDGVAVATRRTSLPSP